MILPDCRLRDRWTGGRFYGRTLPMRWALRTRKSAGISVTKAVHALIVKGNEARDAERWSIAAAHFREALDREPGLYHIWIQLGHAAKEIGNCSDAEVAYRKAAELRPGSGEPHLHLGHLYKLNRDRLSAGRAYFRAVELDPTNADAVFELHHQLARTSGTPRNAMLELLRRTFPDLARADCSHESGGFGRTDAHQPDTLQTGAAQPEGVAPIFDVSDLVSYYGRARLPTGIQRVQIETISRIFAAPECRSRICCVFDGRDEWVEVAAEPFMAVVELSLIDGERNDPNWLRALNRLYLSLALAEPLEIADGACLINLGTSWWLQNYFLHVRNAQIVHGARYVPLIYDLIPVIMPEHCVSELVENFIIWLVGVFDHAAGFLTISEATKRDLIRVAGILGFDIDPRRIEVVRLDADFRRPGLSERPRSELAKQGLECERFVLFVSTIESRKGHIVALEAWKALILRHGAGDVPRLVCVGANGWLNADVYRCVAEDELLASRVTFLSSLSDSELALLYQNCLFAIYPSLYEGWGLPITEALCYGKAVIASESSSLPEAGGEFVVYVATGSSTELAAAAERLIFDEGARKAIEGRVAREFAPRRWDDIAVQIERAADDFAAGVLSQPFVAPVARNGKYHPVSRLKTSRIWPGLRSGERFRIGTNWLWPESWGCWARPGGAELLIGLPDTTGDVYVALRIRGLPARSARWHLHMRGGTALSGLLPANGERWICFIHRRGPNARALHLNLTSDKMVSISVAGGEQDAFVSVGLCGFFLCGADDDAARSAFLKAITLDSLLDLDAFGEEEVQLEQASPSWTCPRPEANEPSAVVHA